MSARQRTPASGAPDVTATTIASDGRIDDSGGTEQTAALEEAVAKRIAAQAAALRAKLDAVALRRRVWWAAAAVLAFVGVIIALLAPHLRASLALFAGAALLLWVRAAYFPLPGVRTTPFSGVTSLARLLSGGPPPVHRRRD